MTSPTSPETDTVLVRALAALPGLGRYSARRLVAVGVTSVQDFLARDPHELYAELEEFSVEPINRLFLKAIVGAQSGVHWQSVRLRKDGRAELPTTHPLAAKQGHARPRRKSRDEVETELQTLSCIGPAMARHLWESGFRSVGQFQAANPVTVWIRMFRNAPGTITLPHLRAIFAARGGTTFGSTVVPPDATAAAGAVLQMSKRKRAKTLSRAARRH